ncbi:MULTISPECIES: M20 metallopeptidase family protein [Antarcticibacterium]|nr:MULTISPECIES: M20 family metallopeptidase [Antarcticibacterium]
MLILIISALQTSAQQAEDLHQRVQQHSEAIFNDLVEVRRDLHRYPEVSGKEEKTSAKVADYLKDLGLEVHTNIGGYGVVGILQGGKPGKRIAWRADMDAMPSEEPDVVDFASEIEGVRHICGHDVHTAVGLGIANVLSQLKQELQGTVYFIFQPSEENYEGAKAMINNGLFKKIDPQEIYGLHISPWPAGTVATKSGSVYSHLNSLKITFKNEGKKDALIEDIKEMVSGFQNVEADSKFWDFRNLEDPEAGLESPATVFTNFLTVSENFNIRESAENITMSTLINTSDKKLMDSLPGKVRQKILESPYSSLLEEVVYTYEKITVNNDEELTFKTLELLADIYGKESVVPVYGVVPQGRGDDFAYFQQEVPGVYYFLGGANYESGVISMPHAPDFNVDEESIKFGVEFFSSVLVDRLILR